MTTLTIISLYVCYLKRIVACVPAWGLGLGCAVQLSMCCLGGFLARLHLRSLCGVLYSGTLSERDVGTRSTPHGFAYCKSSRERRVGSPAGQYLGCAWYFLSCSSSSVVPWDCASRLAPARLSRAPRSGCDSPPSATPWCFPISDARRVYLVDSFIACDAQPNTRTKSPVSHLLRSHLQWLANCSYSNGGRPSPSLHLFTRTWIQLTVTLLSRRTH